MIDHESAIPLLFHIVKTAQEPRNYYAARALTRWRSSEVLGFLFENIYFGGPMLDRHTAVSRALSEHRVDIVNLLIQVAADLPVPGDDFGRLSYLSLVVARHKDPKARTYLSRAFASSDPRLRKGALRLSVVADKGRVLQALTDPDPAIRAEARTLRRLYLASY